MNGGFDVYAGFPLYLALRNARIEVHLGNLSFASLDLLGVEWEADGLARVTAEAPEVRAYLELVEFAEAATPRRASIVSGSIASAIEGRFGDHHRTDRTAGSRLFINPLMSLQWFFDLPRLAARVRFLSALDGTRSWGKVSQAIGRYRASLPERRAFEIIPV